MVLRDLLYKVAIEAVTGNTSVSVRNVHFDSRQVSLNDLFVAVRGVAVDGHTYIDQAVNQGALVIVCEELPNRMVNGITYVQVQNSKKALAVIASNFYGTPSENLKLVGVTGTNGKTTVATLLYTLFQKAGYKVGLISTVAIYVGEERFDTSHTTPDSLTINLYLKQMNDAGVEFCFMEVSSHGIHQERTEALHLAGGVFTNLSHDHLDYHKTFKEYRDVKKRFFDQLPKKAFALTNADDKNGRFMLQNTKAKQKTYALKSHADYHGKILENSFEGLLMRINDHEVWAKLVGRFNAYNMVAVYAVADLLQLETSETLQYLSSLSNVRGRFQYMISPTKITAIVDYAHTPDALDNILQTINEIRTRNEQLITVVGCGGDRDREKRPVMGRIAAEKSDKIIFTNDNPRTEDPNTIIKEIEAGVSPVDYKKTLSIMDRLQAIRTACQMANANDIILIAGKGHETYQEINGVRSEFDDYKIVKEELEKMEK